MLSLSFDQIKKLKQKKYRDEFGYFLAEGEHLVIELAKAIPTHPALSVAEVFIGETFDVDRPLGNWAKPLCVHRLGRKQIEALSDTENPQGIVAVVPIVAPAPASAAEKVIYLHEIQDPGNLGTILRSLAWFGAFRCLLSPNSVDPYNPKVVRASMGAIFHVPIETDVTVAALLSRYPKLAVLDMDGSAISQADFKDFDAYVFGNEARGLAPSLQETLQATRYSIPGGRHIDSLNLATAVNLCAYELNRR